jgi:hypothetical protein
MGKASGKSSSKLAKVLGGASLSKISSNSQTLKQFIGATAALVSLSSLSIFICVQYLDFNPFPSLFFSVTDGWCPVNSAPIFANHCFGDFGAMLQVAAQRDPWSNSFANASYPAAGLLIFLPFVAVWKLTGSYMAAALTYLFAGVLAVVIPTYLALHKQSPLFRVSMTLLTVTSFPILFAIDRGNSIIFCVPLLWGFLAFARTARWLNVSALIVALTMLKPHFAILLLVPFGQRKYRLTLTTAGAIVVSQLGSYLVWYQSLPNSIFATITSLQSYQTYQNLANPWPSNVSLVRPIFWIEFILRSVSSGSLELGSFGEYFSVQNASFLSTAMLLALAIGLVFASKGLRLEELAINFTILACLAPSVSFAYYLVFAVPVAAQILKSDDDDSLGYVNSRAHHRSLLVLALSLSLVKVPLPLSFSLSLTRLSF